MTVFVVLGLMTAAALALLVLPLLRRRGEAAPREAYDLRVYRDQLREFDREAERGLIGPAQQATARAEIERRMLGAATPAPKRPPWSAPSTATAFVVALALPLAAGVLYLWLGTPSLDGRPFAGREQLPVERAGTAESVDIAAMVERLARRLETETDDLEGWLMLGRSYGVLERFDDAVAAFRRAAAISNGDPDVIATLAEHQVFAANGIVTPAAAENFSATLEKSPRHPAAQFYLAVARVQAGDLQGAFDRWVALAKDAPADATWLPAVRAQIGRVARELGVEVPEIAAAAAPSPTRADVAAAADMSAEDRTEMIRGMVAGLAKRLDGQPDDLAGWVRLARAYRVLGETARARDAFARAAALDPDNPARLEDHGAAIVATAPDGAPLPGEAVAVYRRLADLDGDNRAALWHLGRAEAEAGNVDQARANWRRLRALLPLDGPDRAALDRAIAELGEAPASR